MKRTLLMMMIGAALLLITVGVFWFRHHGAAPRHATSAAKTPLPPDATNTFTSAIVRPAAIRWQMMRDLTTNAATTTPAEPGTENWQPVSLTREQIEQYVAREHRSAASLLAAFTLAQDASFLLEAAERFPDDPRVQLAALGMDAFPGERERWLEAFQQSAPDNALAGYLLALDSFRNADPEQALHELADAGSKPMLDFYHDDASAELVNAYRASGQSEGAALMSAMTITPLPHLVELRELAKEMETLTVQQRQQGDTAAADALTRSGLMLAAQLSGAHNGTFLIEELVGMRIERMFLETLDPSATLVGSRQTVAQRLAELQSKRQKISDVAHAADLEKNLPALSDADLVHYFNLASTEGEYNALLWLRDRQKRR